MPCLLLYINTHTLPPSLPPFLSPPLLPLGLALTAIACLTFAAKLLDLNVVGAINQVRKRAEGEREGGRKGRKSVHVVGTIFCERKTK